MYLMIDNYDSFTFNVVQLFGMIGAEMSVYRNDAIDIPTIRSLRPRAVVISPGPCTPTEAGISMAVVESLLGELPLFGICLGHQSIAQALGGRVIRASQVVHGKTSQISHDDQGIFAGVELPFTATRYHSLIVEPETLPTTLEVSARAATGEIMGLRHRESLCVGVQFHPESVLTEAGRALVANFVSMVDAFWAAGPKGDTC